MRVHTRGLERPQLARHGLLSPVPTTSTPQRVLIAPPPPRRNPMVPPNSWAPWRSADSFLRGGLRRRARRRRAAAGGFPARVASRRSVASCAMVCHGVSRRDMVCHGVSVSLLVSGWGRFYRSREEMDSLGTLGFNRTRARRCARIRVSASGPKRARPAWRLLVALVVVEQQDPSATRRHPPPPYLLDPSATRRHTPPPPLSPCLLLVPACVGRRRRDGRRAAVRVARRGERARRDDREHLPPAW